MRTLARMTLTCSLLLACNGDGNMATTQASKTSDPNPDPTADPTAQSASDLSATGTTAEATTAGPEPTTTTDAEPGSTTEDPTTGGDAGLMSQYGAPCVTDADCVKVLGEGGQCLKDILGVYALPGGYCSTTCSLPDQQVTSISMAADCKLGADCIGLMGYFEGCALPCSDNSQCPRASYECRQMPQISNESDPTYCLMTEDNMI